MAEIHVIDEGANNPYRLGRHKWEDPNTEAFDVRKIMCLTPALPTQSAEHDCLEQPWDQGNIGACTANAALGCLITVPFATPGRAFTEADAVALYGEETQLDEAQIPGVYPPVDTGSTGPWSMLALQKRGLIRGYQHITDYVTALNVLLTSPISIGVTWYKSMFTPDANGLIKVDQSSGIAGGHQVCVVGVDATNKLIKIRNSWGTSWAQGGYCFMSWDDFAFLMNNGGDAVVPVL